MAVQCAIWNSVMQVVFAMFGSRDLHPERDLVTWAYASTENRLTPSTATGCSWVLPAMYLAERQTEPPHVDDALLPLRAVRMAMERLAHGRAR